jgi:signal peptidase I
MDDIKTVKTPETLKKKRRPFLALFISIGYPGLGQIYNGQIKKAFGLFFIHYLFLILLIYSGIPHTFFGGLSLVVLIVLTWIIIWVDAFISAWKIKEMEMNKYQRWYVYIGSIVLIYLISYAVYLNPRMRPYRMPAQSMKQTIVPREQIIVDMKYYKSRAPERGDVIVFPHPNFPDEDYIKRVIGLGGEQIHIIDDVVYINDDQIDEPYVFLNMEHEYSSYSNFGPFDIPSGHLFVMGDNRRASYDSRGWGTVEEYTVKGKPLYIHISKEFKRIGKKIE